MHAIIIMGFCTMLETAAIPADASGWCLSYRQRTNPGAPSCPSWWIQAIDIRGMCGKLAGEHCILGG